MKQTLFNTKLLLEYIKTNKLTRAEFAKQCGISVVTLRKILSGKGRVQLMAIIKISMVTKIKFEEIVKE